MPFTGGAAGTLWHLNLKINTLARGFNLKFHFVDTVYSNVVTKSIDLASRLLVILPTDAEIFFATVSNDNTTKDSRFIRGALGAGHYAPGSPAVPSKFDMPQTQLLVRLEDTEGSEVPRKIGPIPDEIVTDAEVVSSITDVTGMPALPLAAIGSGTTWADNFNLLMQSIVANTVHVLGGHPPGGIFQYAQWLNAYVLRPCVKRGGRVFI